MSLSEDDLQMACVRWCQTKNVFVHHSPNGGYRTGREAMKFKSMGVVAGFPDLFLPDLRLFVELKSPSGGGRVSKEQEAVHERLRASGYHVFVLDSFDGFKVLVETSIQRANDALARRFG